MGRGRQIKWWQVTLGFLLIAALSAGLGGLIGIVVVGIRALFDPPLSYVVVLPIVLIIMIGYFKLVWVPIWTLRSPKNERDV